MSSMRTFELQIITLTDETRLKLDNFAERFNLALHHLYKEDCKVNNKLTKNQFKSEYQLEFNLNARHFNSVFDTMRGNTSSALECAKLHLEDIRLKLYDIKKEIKRLETKQKKYLESSTSVKALKPAKKVAVFTAKDKSKLYRLKQKVPKLENTLIALMKQISENKPQLCFGSKKLFNEQFTNPEHDHAEWKQRWINARNSNFMLVGSKDESYGNVNAQLTYVESNTNITPAVDDKKYNIEDLELYQLRVNLKDSIEIINVCIPYGHYLKQAIRNNAQTKNKDKQALTFRFKRDWDKGLYRIWVSLDVEKQEVPTITTRQLGMIGVDFNIDHLAVANVDHQGNIIDRFNIDLNLYGKSTTQASSIIGNAVKTLVSYAEQHEKPIVLENLDFSKKKRELYKSDCSKKHKRMISSFAYSRIRELIRARCYDLGIEVIAVNPAYTSKIGEVKYQERYHLTVHQAAAMTIARRGMNLRERRVIPYKGNLCSSVVPARNQQKKKVNYWENAVQVKRAHVEQRLIRRPKTRVNDFYFGSSTSNPYVVVQT